MDVRGIGGHVGLITGQGHERDSLFPSAMPEKETKNNEKMRKKKKKSLHRVFSFVSKEKV